MLLKLRKQAARKIASVTARTLVQFSLLLPAFGPDGGLWQLAKGHVAILSICHSSATAQDVHSIRPRLALEWLGRALTVGGLAVFQGVGCDEHGG